MQTKQIQTAIVVVAAIIAICYVVRRWRNRKDKFVSEQAKQVFDSAKPLFEKTSGRPSYSDYKTNVQTADPVQYTDLKKLWADGKFTPERVQAAL